MDFLITIFLLLATFLYFIAPESSPIFFNFINTPPVLVFMPIAFFSLIATLRKLPIARLTQVTVLIFLVFLAISVKTRPYLKTPAPEATATKYRICSWNTAYFFEYTRQKSLEFLSKQNCDIIMLQEVWRSDLVATELETYRATLFPKYHLERGEEFITLYSDKFTGIKTSPAKNQGHLQVELKLANEKLLTVINTHIWNPIVPRPEYDENNQVYYLKAREFREKEQDELVDDIAAVDQTKESVVVMGDFNTMQNNVFFSRLSAPWYAFKDNAPLTVVNEPLLRWDATYPAKFPILHIDYTFVSKKNLNGATLQKQCLPQYTDHCLMILEVLL